MEMISAPGHIDLLIVKVALTWVQDLGFFRKSS